MTKPKRTEKIIPLDRIFLHLENPRHEPFEKQSQIIEWLCSNEEVPQLARDIAQHGLSPFDRFGVFLDHNAEANEEIYITAEGNRRLCALMLLADPDLAPPEKKSFFENQVETWSPITEVPCVIFHDLDDLDLWLKRRHHGLAGGIGQKPWNSDQKARHSGTDSRNRLALAFLDYAEQQGLISLEDRKGKLTTVQRFLGNPLMREMMGLDLSTPDNLSRNRPDDDFKRLSQQFIADMLAENPKVHSRQNKENIVAYARELESIRGLSHERIEPEPINPEPQQKKQKRKRRPKKARHPQLIPWSQDIHEELRQLGNWKLESLYHSICSIPLEGNTPLLAVGAWSFFETLTAKAKRNQGTDFYSFLSANKLGGYGLGSNQQHKPLRNAIQRIMHYGNTTKHHDTAAAFNGDQLANDMESLVGVILKIIEDANDN